MGISANALKFLLYCKKEFHVDFSNTATLGRQSLTKDKTTINIIKNYINKESAIIDEFYANGYCEFLLHKLGAYLVDSFDYSNYEEASYLHDMNTPIPEQYKNKYTLLIDGGTLEHIFNIPVSFKNIIDMVAIGGHVINVLPMNNYCGHGFYQFSPEFFYSLFSGANGFEVKEMAYADEKNSKLYSIPDPLKLGQRVQISKTPPNTLIFVLSKKIAHISELAVPQQSDYENMVWRGIAMNVPVIHEGSFYAMLKKHCPLPVKIFLKKIISYQKQKYLKLK